MFFFMLVEVKTACTMGGHQDSMYNIFVVPFERVSKHIVIRQDGFSHAGECQDNMYNIF